VSGVRTILPSELPAYLAADGRLTRVLLDPATGHPGLELYDVELPPGGASELHTRPHPEVLVVLEATVGVETRGSVHEATAGSILYIPAGVEHRHVNVGKVSARFLGIFAPPTGHADEVRKRPTVGSSLPRTGSV